MYFIFKRTHKWREIIPRTDEVVEEERIIHAYSVVFYNKVLYLMSNIINLIGHLVSAFNATERI